MGSTSREAAYETPEGEKELRATFVVRGAARSQGRGHGGGKAVVMTGRTPPEATRVAGV